MTNNTEDPLFTINFIKAIENRPCIYNYGLSEYSKRNKTEKAWKEVAEEVKDTGKKNMFINYNKLMCKIDFCHMRISIELVLILRPSKSS